jgi:hypothetical protein
MEAPAATGAMAATETADTAAASRSFAGTPSTVEGLAEVLLALGMLNTGWKKAEPKLLDAGVVTNHSTFYRARKRAINERRLRSSQP